MVRTIRIQNSRSGIVRLNRRDLRLVLSARIPAIILVSGPACPRCTALKRALLPLLQERGFTIFEAGYFDAYATLSPEELKKYHLPRVYSFPTLILAGGDSSAPIRLTYGAEGVEGLVDALLKNMQIPADLVLHNGCKERGFNTERAETLEITSTQETICTLAPTGDFLLVEKGGQGHLVPADR